MYRILMVVDHGLHKKLSSTTVDNKQQQIIGINYSLQYITEENSYFKLK